jgi:hypothetical protein
MASYLLSIGPAQARRGNVDAQTKLHEISSSANDSFGDDHWNSADGARTRRRRRAECASGPAVIGGLLFATVATLLFVPTLFSLLHGRKTRKQDEIRFQESL